MTTPNDNTRRDGVRSIDCSANSLAAKIADAILTLPDGRKCHRVALKSGSYPDHENDEGGYCASALEGVIREHLLDYLSNAKADPTAKD